MTVLKDPLDMDVDMSHVVVPHLHYLSAWSTY
jgi:hypothetical protein